MALVVLGKKAMRETIAAKHSVHPTGRSRRAFRRFAWLEVGSVKAALPRPAQPRVTQQL